MAEEKEFTYDMLMQSFKEIRNLMQENDIKAEKRAAEWEKRNAEYEKAREKSAAEYEKWKKEMQKYLGGISESNGAMAEEMIFNSLEQDMIFAGIEFYDITANMKKKNKAKNLTGEYDIVLTNGDTIAIVEAKYKVREKDITKLVSDKVEKFRKLFPMYSAYKIILGIGGMSFEQKAIEDAKNNGVGIIKIVGDKVEFHTDGIRIY